MSVVGVDACKKGWVAVELPDDGVPVAHHLAVIDDVRHAAPKASVIGIDIPIGLPPAGKRAADLEARARLGARRNSVFMTPPRAVLQSASHAAATALAVALGGPGISQQSYALAARIFEVERWLASAPCRVIEVHPEVSFATMLGRPATASKKTWAGMVERRTALASERILLDSVAGAATTHALVDDMLDAAAAAWTARRASLGLAISLPDPPELDRSGSVVAIWA